MNGKEDKEGRKGIRKEGRVNEGDKEEWKRTKEGRKEEGICNNVNKRSGRDNRGIEDRMRRKEKR